MSNTTEAGFNHSAALKALKTQAAATTRAADGGCDLRRRQGGILLDARRQHLHPADLQALLAFADDAAFDEQRRRLFAGERVNHTEERAVLHSALRASGDDLERWSGSKPDRQSVRELVMDTRRRMQCLVEDVHLGRRTGYSGARFTDIVNIGIGGSHLGPELIVDALADQALLRTHFLSNIDGHRLSALLRSLDPTRTLFVIASKSFTTLETALNAEAARSWFLERTANREAIGNHFVAVSNNVDAALEFGLDGANVLPMGDWVGGRFSLWSAVGLSIALALGWDAFSDLLEGARSIDKHFESAPAADNLPLLMALLDLWNIQVRGCTSHAVLSYDERLRLLPDFLQQLEMESNGKSIDGDAEPVDYPTQPVLWGGVGTNGQHAYHQQLHQGTGAYWADFIVCRAVDHNYPELHQSLAANALAQSQAMAVGREHADPHRRVSGQNPSSLWVLDELSPTTLGQLLSLFEHKTFCLGILWNINSFDQWGVELGKVLAVPIAAALAGQRESDAIDDSVARSQVEYLGH
ncbi:MAG: glucose-6-phosphate isomerase [Pseudomonadota bacterium]